VVDARNAQDRGAGRSSRSTLGHHFARESPMRRTTVLIALLLVTAGCGTTTHRLYDGPPRAASELAVVEVYQDSTLELVTLGGVHGEIVEVDGLRVDAERVELLPGTHELCATFRRTAGYGSIDFAGRLSFRAEAGVAYRLHPYLDAERGNGVALLDTSTGATVVDSYVPPAQLNPVRLDLSSEGWQLAAGAQTCTQRLVTWLRTGDTLREFSEIVEVVETSYPPGVRPDLAAALRDREDTLDDATAIGDEWRVLEQSDTHAAFQYSGQLLGTRTHPAGLGVLRVRGGRLLLFTYEVRNRELPDADRDAWLARFKRE